MSLKQFDPFLALGGKIDPLSEIRNAGIITNGSVFWVKSGSDSDWVTFQDQVGAANIRNTAQEAVSAARDDMNDYILVVPPVDSGIFALGTAVDLNKDRLHLLGVGAGRRPQFENGPTFRGFVAANGIDTELVNITGAGVEVGGLRSRYGD